MNSNAGGTGNFCLPFYGGSMMGLADANKDGAPDLWLQGTNAGGRGIYLCYFKKYSEQGIPVFSAPVLLRTPFKDGGKNQGVVFEDKDGRIYTFWRFGSVLKWSRYDVQQQVLLPLETAVVEGVPKRTNGFGVLRHAGGYAFFFSVTKEGRTGPGGGWPRVVSYTPEGFWPYDIAEAGICRAVVSDWKKGGVLNVQSCTGPAVAFYGFDGFTAVEHDTRNYLVAGTRLGNIYAFPQPAKDGEWPQHFLADPEQLLHRNPVVHCYTAYFKGPGNKKGIISQGEGGIFFYKDKLQTTPAGDLVFEDPVPLQQEQPLLYGGSLVVPNLTDWDGDGVLDLISGTSSGQLLFFKNTGSNQLPRMQNPVPLKAGGYTVHIQPGYREDIQGPGEARWGYTCLNVADWNGDGLPDIVLGDSRGKFTVYINKGTAQQPLLDAPRPLYCKGLDLFGSWRVRPGIGLLNGRMVFINQDQDDALHLYRQTDACNLEDGGKLQMEDGAFISGARLPAGAVGRTRIELVDWDGDGIKDLLLGTYGKQSVPDTATGLPFHLPRRGSTVLFLKNKGTEQQPVFAYPRPLLFKGDPILLGGHECAVATGFFGPGDTLNMIVGEENGKYLFYERKDLSW